ncbi:hypothetical protein [Aeromonas veronii]|uniref:hypothetical protein n=1 Tax=Aeromonas veronii TaxID=654 RepID=UPI0024439AF8|nr:hypothetical protein [Aeromonas veronii]
MDFMRTIGCDFSPADLAIVEDSLKEENEEFLVEFLLSIKQNQRKKPSSRWLS